MSFASVIYKWPNHHKWVSTEGNLVLLHKNQKGFVISGFCDENPQIILSEKIIEYDSFPAEKFKQMVKLGYANDCDNETEAMLRYNEAIENAILSVNENKLKKVVISRRQFFECSDENFINGFTLLADSFPNAFIYFLVSEKHGTWFGASPEILVEETKNSFTTMALAGTIKSESDIEMKDWKQKEIEEQKFVADYVADLLKQHEIIFLQEKTGIQRTGNIHHLVNRFNLIKKSDLSLMDIAKFLHPTPAICGLPLNASREFILQNEGYDRALYTGFLGPVGMQQHNGFFVNLRCGKKVRGGAVLYAGGGINKGSVAVDELNETKNKMENTWRFFS